MEYQQWTNAGQPLFYDPQGRRQPQPPPPPHLPHHPQWQSSVAGIAKNARPAPVAVKQRRVNAAVAMLPPPRATPRAATKRKVPDAIGLVLGFLFVEDPCWVFQRSRDPNGEFYRVFTEFRSSSFLMFGFFRPVQAAEEQPAAAEGRPAEEQPAAAAAEGRPAPRPLLGIRLLSGSIGHILAWHSRISVGRPGSARGPGEAFFLFRKKKRPWASPQQRGLGFLTIHPLVCNGTPMKHFKKMTLVGGGNWFTFDWKCGK